MSLSDLELACRNVLMSVSEEYLVEIQSRLDRMLSVEIEFVGRMRTDMTDDEIVHEANRRLADVWALTLQQLAEP